VATALAGGLGLLVVPAAQAATGTPADEEVIATYPTYQECRYEGEEMTLSGQIPDQWYCQENDEGTVDLILDTDE
jgi:hypothetical protein